jgi:hypothetical protein
MGCYSYYVNFFEFIMVENAGDDGGIKGGGNEMGTRSPQQGGDDRRLVRKDNFV